MAQVRLEAGARPPKHQLAPVKGADGLYRLDRIRHRTFSGNYTRTSGIGRTQKECLADWDKKFEVNRHKGSVRVRRTETGRKRFTEADQMLDVFDHFMTVQEQRVAKGAIKKQTYETYERMIYVSEGPRSKAKALRLETELGHLTVGEVGDPGFLCDYFDDIVVIAPGIAHQHYTVLSAVFKMLTRGGVFKYSPMKPVPAPVGRGGKQRALKPAEREALYELFLRRAKHTKYRMMLFLLILGTGLRIGEVLALRWMDVDLRTGDETAVVHICGTLVKPSHGCVRQDKRKGDGRFYYLTLPMWLTQELRAWRAQVGEVAPTDHVLTSKQGGFVSLGAADQLLRKVLRETPLEWVQYGNFRDTAATHVTGKTAHPLRASAQLGHAEAQTIATVHYIDHDGYIRPAVDNAEAMESLKPSKLEQSWNLEAA